MDKLITIKDIAKEANVSAGTVDRVLHKRGGVSPKTEEKIKKILKQKKFKINQIASSLAMKKHLNLSTLIPFFDEDNLFWKSPFSGIQKASEQVSAYGVETNNFFFDQFDPKSYIEAYEKLIKTKPDAVVMAPLFIKETVQIISSLNEKETPFLFLNVNQQGYNNLCYIGQKSFEGGALAGQLIDLCIQAGDEILIVQTRKNLENYSSISQRVKGFINFFEKNNLNTSVHQVQFEGLTNLKKTAETINELLKKNRKIKGIVIPSSRASNIVELINPSLIEGLKVVGYDTTPKNVSALKKGQITFLISQKSFNQGYKSITTMVNYLIHKEVPEAELPTPLEIVTRENVEFIEYDKRRYNSEL